MKKGLFFFLVIFTGQLYGFPRTHSNTFFFSDILLWKVKTSSTDNFAQEISPAGTTQSIKLFGVPFKWSPGIRLGVGYNPYCSDWDIIFSLTWFQTKGKSQASANSGGIYSSFLGNFFINNTNGALIRGPNYRSANIQWKVLFNIYDLEIGHTFQVDPCLKLKPFIGLKGGWINHNIYSNWQNPTVATTFTSASENLKNHFWGIGPSLGLNTTWSLYENPIYSFNLLGNFSGALLWGHWRFQDIYRNNTPTTVSVNLSPVQSAASMARAFMGFEWVGCLKEANFAIRLGYEAQIWFNQMQYYSLNMGRLNSLMSLQGGVLSLEFRF